MCVSRATVELSGCPESCSTDCANCNLQSNNECIIISYIYSVKLLKPVTKDNSSPFFLDVGSKNPVFRTIYDFISGGVKGNIRKDVLFTILQDISVSGEARMCGDQIKSNKRLSISVIIIDL